MASYESSAELAAIAAELQHAPDEALTSRAVVDRMADLVPGADQVSLTVRVSRDRHRTLASTAGIAKEADALQYALDEGPCIEIADSGGWVRSGDVARDERWPRWGSAAADLGVASLLSVAVLDHEQPLGALNVYSTSIGAFAERDVVDLALVYAVHATTALSSARLAENLHTAMSSRHLIGMAQGIIMERFAIDEHRSFDLLRRISSTDNQKLRAVAAAIVSSRTVPHVGDGEPDSG